MTKICNPHDQLIVPQDHQSIFGDTIHGVPSPTIPHEHPYPTRFHGPIYHYPRFFLPYREQSYIVPSDYIGKTRPAYSGIGQTDERSKWLVPVVIIGVVGFFGLLIYSSIQMQKEIVKKEGSSGLLKYELGSAAIGIAAHELEKNPRRRRNRRRRA